MCIIHMSQQCSNAICEHCHDYIPHFHCILQLQFVYSWMASYTYCSCLCEIIFINGIAFHLFENIDMAESEPRSMASIMLDSVSQRWCSLNCDYSLSIRRHRLQPKTWCKMVCSRPDAHCVHFHVSTISRVLIICTVLWWISTTYIQIHERLLV